MSMKRIVNDIECEIPDFNNVEEYGDLNTLLWWDYNNIISMIEEQIDANVPQDLKDSIDHKDYREAVEQSIDYMRDLLRESSMARDTFMEDTLCYFYDCVEKIGEPKDEYNEFYIKLWGTKADYAMMNTYARQNHLCCDYTRDPLEFTVQDAVMNAMERGIMERDDIVLDAYTQLDSAINSSDIFEVYIDDYMIKNSI